MTLSVLNSKQLHGAIVFGCREVIAQQDLLNEMNVFPVPDSDTGSNMASTAKAVMSYSSVKGYVNETLKSVAEASLIGARGNSGMIFSQFFNGLSEHVEPKEHLTITDFSKLLTQASTSARQALLAPLDGTMLTIMQTWATQFTQLSAYKSCFYEALQSALPKLQYAVEQTTETLEALKKTNLVDAGALGFYHFVNGFATYLSNPKSNHVVFEQCHDHVHLSHEIIAPDTPLTYRYCTEAIIRFKDFDKDQLKAFLSQHGDSIVLSGSHETCRFHLHTDKPGHVFTELMQHGTLEYPKVDDMLRQKQAAHHRQEKIALVTDSSADLPAHLKDQYQIHVLPLNLSLESHQFLDGFGFEPNEFYRNLEQLKTYPQTSLPSVPFIQEKLAYLANHYQQVLVLPLSKALSGTYDGIMKASQKLENVHVVNSRTSSAALGLLVTYAAELIAEKKSIHEIIPLIDKAIDNTYIFVSLAQLDSMIRSGRINALSGKLAKLSGIKPVISIDKQGKGSLYDKIFSSKKALSKLVKIAQDMEDSYQKIKRYCIVHADAEEKAEELAERCHEAFGKPPEYIVPVSAAIGLHAGRDSVAIGLMLQ